MLPDASAPMSGHSSNGILSLAVATVMDAEGEALVDSIYKQQIITNRISTISISRDY